MKIEEFHPSIRPYVDHLLKNTTSFLGGSLTLSKGGCGRRFVEGFDRFQVQLEVARSDTFKCFVVMNHEDLHNFDVLIYERELAFTRNDSFLDQWNPDNFGALTKVLEYLVYHWHSMRLEQLPPFMQNSNFTKVAELLQTSEQMEFFEFNIRDDGTAMFLAKLYIVHPDGEPLVSLVNNVDETTGNILEMCATFVISCSKKRRYSSDMTLRPSPCLAQVWEDMNYRMPTCTNDRIEDYFKACIQAVRELHEQHNQQVLHPRQEFMALLVTQASAKKQDVVDGSENSKFRVVFIDHEKYQHAQILLKTQLSSTEATSALIDVELVDILNPKFIVSNLNEPGEPFKIGPFPHMKDVTNPEELLELMNTQIKEIVAMLTNGE